MPYWQNRFTDKHVSLERRDGKGASIVLDPEQAFWGSTYYAAFSASQMSASDYMLTRTTDVRLVQGTHLGSDVWEFRTEEPFKPDSLTASAADAAIYTATTADTAYTAWGTIEWTDAGGTSTKEFALNGDGKNSTAASPSSVFTVEATAGSATADLAAVNDAGANHFVMAAAGVIRLKFDASITSAKISVNYDPVEGGLNAGTGHDHPAKGKRATTVRTFVLAADNTSFPLWYVATSVGQVKTEKIFQTGTPVGSPALLRTYFYESTNTSNPGGNKPLPSRVVEEDSTVTETDLTLAVA